MCQASRLSSRNTEADIIPMPYSATMARVKTSDQLPVTAHGIIDAEDPAPQDEDDDGARVSVMNSPPTAMPSKTAIIELGAMMYSARLPCSFSQ